MMAATAMLKIQAHAIKLGNYHPISMKIGTQTKKNILSSKVTKVEVTDRFQDGRRRHVGNSSACYKMGTYHRTLMKKKHRLRQTC
jgi:hypothetical protein